LSIYGVTQEEKRSLDIGGITPYLRVDHNPWHWAFWTVLDILRIGKGLEGL
jgi:hypothetical protein